MSSGYRLVSIFLYFLVSLGFWMVLVFWVAMGAAAAYACSMQAVWSWTRFQIIRYDFTKIHVSLLFTEKSLRFFAMVLDCERADVEASQSGFRGFMDPAANRASEWLGLWKRQHRGGSAMERWFRMARSVGVMFSLPCSMMLWFKV